MLDQIDRQIHYNYHSFIIIKMFFFFFIKIFISYCIQLVKCVFVFQLKGEFRLESDHIESGRGRCPFHPSSPSASTVHRKHSSIPAAFYRKTSPPVYHPFIYLISSVFSSFCLHPNIFHPIISLFFCSFPLLLFILMFRMCVFLSFERKREHFEPGATEHESST